MTSLWFQSFLLPDGWAERVRIDIALGRIHSIQAGVSPESGRRMPRDRPARPSQRS